MNMDAAEMLDWQQALTTQGRLLGVQQQQLAIFNAKLTQFTNTLALIHL